jgi:hypothetical protein
VTSPTSLSETHLPAERVVMSGARDRTQANRVTLSILVAGDPRRPQRNHYQF